MAYSDPALGSDGPQPTTPWTPRASGPPRPSLRPGYVSESAEITPAVVGEPAKPDAEPATSIDLCGIRITRLTGEAFITIVRGCLSTPDSSTIAVGSVNLDHIHHFGRRGRRPARNAGVATDPHWLMLADGSPITRRASAVSGLPWPRLTGADLLPLLLDLALETGARVGFLGGTPESVTALQVHLQMQWPELQLAGCWTPPRADLVDPQRSGAVATSIAEAGVDLLVVGLGKPLQERWIDEHGAQSGARVLTAFGAAADFLAGTTRRAPLWMQTAGCEWLYRLSSEPRRLSRRYLLEGPPALYGLLADRQKPARR